MGREGLEGTSFIIIISFETGYINLHSTYSTHIPVAHLMEERRKTYLIFNAD